MGEKNTYKKDSRIKNFKLILHDNIEYKLSQFPLKCFQKYTTLYDIILITVNYKMGDNILIGTITKCEYKNRFK